MKLKEPPVDRADMSEMGRLFTAERIRLIAWVEKRMDPGLAARVWPEDIVEDVFVRCCSRLADFKLSGMEAFEWLRQIAQDCLFDETRRQLALRRNVKITEPLPDSSSISGLASPVTSPSERLRRKEREQRLLDLLELLPTAYRELLSRLYLQEKKPTLRDVGEELGLAESAARVRHFRALKKLKVLWQEKYPDEELDL